MGYRTRKMKTSNVLKAMKRYLEEFEPCSTHDIVENMTFKNGRLVRQTTLSVTPHQVAGILAKSRWAEVHEARGKPGNTWRLRRDEKGACIDE